MTSLYVDRRGITLKADGEALVFYENGERPGDVLKMTVRDIVDDALTVSQGKTGKRIRIRLTGEDGERTELGRVIDRILCRKVTSLYLVATPDGRRMTAGMLRLRFVAARDAAASAAEHAGDARLASSIRQFQFRDARPKAASEIADLAQAAELLGHSDKQLTRTVYTRIGKLVKPTR